MAISHVAFLLFSLFFPVPKTLPYIVIMGIACGSLVHVFPLNLCSDYNYYSIFGFEIINLSPCYVHWFAPRSVGKYLLPSTTKAAAGQAPWRTPALCPTIYIPPRITE